MSAIFPCKVLVVDDHPFQLAYLRELFGLAGVFDFHVANNGVEALQMLEQESFNLLLSDLMMPELDGVQLIQRLSKMGNCPPVALMTAMPKRMLKNVAGVAKALGIEVIDQLAKPPTPEAIRRLLERLSAIRRPYRSHVSRAQRAFNRTTLELAISARQFQAWFQPKLHLSSGRIFAAEALVRWCHPQDGVLMPSEFLNDLAHAGLEQELLFYMLEQVIQTQIASYSQKRQVKMSLNLPGHLLDIPDLPDRLYSRVRELGGKPGAIVLELTESSTTVLPSSFHAAACRLRMMGFGLSLDDFGKGYSSFSNLLGAPFTEIKLDRSLVSESMSDQVCRSALESIVDLARKLEMEVVAEGVENQAQLSLMRELKCDFIQGFLIAPALPATQFKQMLR